MRTCPLHCMLIVVSLCFSSATGAQTDTGTVVFRHGSGSVTGCFTSIVDASGYCGDSMVTFTDYPDFYREWDSPEIVGIGCNEDTGWTYPVKGHFFCFFQPRLKSPDFCKKGEFSNGSRSWRRG